MDHQKVQPETWDHSGSINYMQLLRNLATNKKEFANGVGNFTAVLLNSLITRDTQKTVFYYSGI